MKEQIKSIKAHLAAHPELAGDPRFQLLFPRNGAAPKMKKRSADKASEAATAAELDADKPPTGANKALLQAKVTVDPPPQFAPVGRPSNNAARQPSPLTLGNVLRDAVNAHQDSSSPEPHSAAKAREDSAPPTTPIFSDDDNESNGNMTDKQHITPPLPGLNSFLRPADLCGAYGGHIIVELHDYHNTALPAEEIWIADPATEVFERINTDGNTEVIAHLSQLIPEALQQNTPTKKRSGRVWRPGVNTATNRVSIGTVASICAGKLPDILRINEVNTYPLHLRADCRLVCNMFLDRSDEVDSTIPLKAFEVSEDPFPPLEGLEALSPCQVPHIPLPSLATTTSMAAVSGPVAPADDAFIVYLRGILGGPARQWPKAETAGQVYDRYMAHRRAEIKLRDELKWGRNMGGYEIPAGKEFEPYGSRTFTRTHLSQAMRIGHTIASTDKKLFEDKKLRAIPLLRAWVEQEDSREADKFFRNMPLGDFRAYIEKELLRDSRDSSSSRKGKKRAKGDGKDDQEHRQKKRKRHDSVVASRPRVLDSDDLEDLDAVYYVSDRLAKAIVYCACI
ncbi:hypothetical protein HGRIS_014635 [Hohenbuehelia grisea]